MGDALRERALRMLARRDHARLELAQKLSPQAESAAQLESLLDALEAGGQLSDERYALARVHWRGLRVGDARLAHELRKKGVSAELVSAVLATGESEVARARRVWQGKFLRQSLDAAADVAAERGRQMRFLAGRGFSAETIRRVLRGDFEDD